MSQPSALQPARQRALVLAESGDLAGAIGLLERAVELGKINLSEDDPDVLRTSQQLAQLLLKDDDPVAARRVLEDAYAAGLWRLGDSDALMLEISHDIGAVAEELGNKHEARKAFSRVAELGPAALGGGHPAVARARAYLGQDQDASAQPQQAPLGVQPPAQATPIPAQPRPSSPPQAPPQSPTSDEPTATLRPVSPTALDEPTTHIPTITPKPQRDLVQPPDRANQQVWEAPPAEPRPAPPIDRPTSFDQRPTQPPPQPPARQVEPTPQPSWEQPSPPSWEQPPQQPSWEQPSPPSWEQPPQQPSWKQPPQQPSQQQPPQQTWPDQQPQPWNDQWAAQPQPDPWPSTPPPYAQTQQPSPHSYQKRGLGIFAAIAAVMAAVIAVAALVFVLANRSSDDSDKDVPTLAGNPPTGVALKDQGSRILVTWKDPTSGTVSFMIAMAHPGEQLKPVATLGPGQTSYEMSALNPGLNYCFAVVAVYRDNKFATSEQACTDRSTATK